MTRSHPPVSRPPFTRGLFAWFAAALLHAGTGATRTRRLTFPRSATALLTAATLLAASTLAASLPAAASAYATIEGPPAFSTISGLPDGRLYEQVVADSELNGNEAGSSTSSHLSGGLDHYGLASPDGNSVAFEGTGPIGESPWGASELFVATRHDEQKAGWSTRAVLPRMRQSITEVGGILGTKPQDYALSSDLSHSIVSGGRGTLGPQLNESCIAQLYVAGPDPLVSATWLEQPDVEAGESAVENCSYGADSAGAPVGGTPSFSTVYFGYPGTLLAADRARAPHAGTGSSVEAWGFYEDHEGTLHEAGVLPDGQTSEFGAVPAASGHGRAIVGNQVADGGTRAFFVSPDPASCEPSGENDCSTDPPELYVRINGERTLLVSQDTLSGHVGDPAPTGALKMPNPALQYGEPFHGSYVFASSDGSQAFFQSADDLTAAAAEASPGSEPKTYDFNVDTGSLTYLPGVAGEIVATDTDGSKLAFVRPEQGGAPAELDVWSGPDAGSVAPVTQLPGPPSLSGHGGISQQGQTPIEYLPDAQFSTSGGVLVFVTATGLSNSFNNGGAEQIYRYDAADNTLGCVSCAPAGVTPRLSAGLFSGGLALGGASISALRASETYEGREPVAPAVQERGISSDGSRIFFDSPDPLVKRDANTNSPEIPYQEEELRAQGRDVYEWENGTVYLISTGTSPRDSYLLDSSENGDSVFFATAEPGLVPGDTDGGYDVYDARIPEPGEGTATSPAPCTGSGCQGPAGSPVPPQAPASAAFSSLGNPTPEAPETTTVTTKPAPRPVKCKRGYVKKKHRCIKAPRKKAKKASTATSKGTAGR